MLRNQWWRGLLARVTIAYALGSLVLSTSIAYFTFTIAQDRLISNFEEAANRQFARNADEVRNSLESLAADSDRVERGDVIISIGNKLLLGNSSRPLLVLEDRDPGLSTLTKEDIPPVLTELFTESENPIGNGRYMIGSEKNYIVGARLVDFSGEFDADYYETFPLTTIDATLSDLRRILIGAAMISSIAGATLGFYAARRALAPITRISSAAKEIAEGNFQTRLDLEVDPDLAILSSSFNEMVDALREKVERDQRFTSDVSHELRSPLMTLTASVEVLERNEDSLPETARQAVGLLGQDVKRFEKLVEDLLEISRMDAGAVQLQLTPFELPRFLVNVIERSANPEIELRHSTRDRDLVITADKRRVAQVITNLINNANKYAGGAKGISFRQVGKTVQITVEDEGPGIPTADRQRIFERFSRGATDAGNRASGTGVGLGLSLVAEHVRLHGGRVWVTDRIDGKHGARFVVELPIGEQFHSEEEMAI